MRLFVSFFYRWFDRTLSARVNLGRWRQEASARGEWNQFIGDRGEDLARRFLWTRGLKVLYCRYRPKGGGEIDIVARDGEVLVFCEVKTRTSREFGDASAAVDSEKQRLIARGAQSWIRELGFQPLIFRFDIIEVYLIDNEPPEVRHIQNAFQAAPRLLA